MKTETLTCRQLAKGAAWTIPVVVVGVAAPANAASSPTQPCGLLHKDVMLTHGPIPDCQSH